MTKTESYLEFLTAEGYRPALDDDKDITFKHERKIGRASCRERV